MRVASRSAGPAAVEMIPLLSQGPSLMKSQIPIRRGVTSTGAWRYRPMITAEDSAFLRRAIEIGSPAATLHRGHCWSMPRVLS